MLTVRHLLFCCVICSLTLVVGQQTALAQPAATNAPAPANVTVATRTFYVEGAVVVLLIAGAVFAVGRSSRRV